MRTLRVCSTPRCANHVTMGRCADCRAKAPRQRGSVKQRGYSGEHTHWRQDILTRDPICRGCRQRPATVGEHIIPLVDGGASTMANGQGCCKDCADYKTRAEQRDTSFGHRLQQAGQVYGEPAPYGWRYMPEFQS